MNDAHRLHWRLLRHMVRIRAVEEEIARRYPEGRMRCPTHLSTGQEAVPAAVAECARDNDFAVSTHRGHAHYLAKGGALKPMLAEIYGKAGGCSRGRGGSMHLIDLSVNFMGTSAIVGNSIPIGVGLALSAQLKRTGQISFVFLGEGAVEEGVFYESANFAAVRKLPVLFVCENNLYSVYSPLSVRQPVGRSIADMVQGIGVESYVGDGNCAVDSHRVISEAVTRVRMGPGPAFVELATYRWREHCGPHFDDDLGYRPKGELAKWQARDPIVRLKETLRMECDGFDPALASLEAEIRDELDEAFQFAEQSPFPQAIDAYQGVYAH